MAQSRSNMSKYLTMAELIMFTRRKCPFKIWTMHFYEKANIFTTIQKIERAFSFSFVLTSKLRFAMFFDIKSQYNFSPDVLNVCADTHCALELKAFF